MEELILWAVAGSFLGILTGLIPGIHPNTISTMLVQSSQEHSLETAVMIVAIATVHSFVAFIPSILLGAPEEATALSVQPGHKMMLEGKGAQAIKLTSAGALATAVIAMISVPIFFLFFERMEKIITLAVPFVLILLLFLMIAKEKRKTETALIIALSGLLGVTVLQGSLNINDPLFPLITGFFGASSLIQSMFSKSQPAKQETEKHSFKPWKLLKASAIGAVSGMVISVLPSLGATQAAFITKKLAGKTSTATHLMILGGISSANTIFALFALFAIQKTRSGTAAAVKALEQTGMETLAVFIATIAIATGIGAIATMVLSEKLATKIHSIPYKKLSKTVLLMLFVLTLAISGYLGAIALLTSTAIGTAAIFLGVKRTTCMAFLMMPTILFYLNQYYF